MKLLYACIALVLTTVSCRAYGSDTLWQIGQGSGEDLAISGRYPEYAQRFPNDVSFKIGISKPADAWPYIQPGPIDAWAGSRQHPFQIGFQLPEGPTGSYRLTVNLANTHYASPPELQIDINGKRRYLYRLPVGTDDSSLQDPKKGKPYRLAIVLPATILNTGNNTITLTGVTGSWLLYRSVQMETGSDIPTTAAVGHMDVTSTMLFIRDEGAIKQIVRVRIENEGTEGDGTLTVGASAPIRVHLESGQSTVEVPVTPFTAKSTLQASFKTGSSVVYTQFTGQPERHWTVFVGPSAHTDIGYTDLQERVFERHNNNTLTAIRAAEADPLFKWNLEVSFQAYLLARDHPDQFPALIRKAKSGQIGIPGSYLNMLTGLCSGEELIECFGRAQSLARKNGFTTDWANISDVPSTVGTLPMLLSKSGVRYFAEAVNSQRAPIFRGANPSFKQSPFWWQGLDGSRVLAIFTEQYAQAGAIGLTSSFEELGTRLPGWLKQFDNATYPADAAYIYGAFSDNQPIDTKYASIAEAWNAKYLYPHLSIGKVSDFFHYVERTAGAKLPVVRGDFGVYWEDGAASSAFETSLSRYARTHIEQAERTGSLTNDPMFKSIAVSTEIRRAWDDILFYDEHTWGAYCSISEPESEQTRKQWQYKSAFATSAADHADKITALSLRAGSRAETVPKQNDYVVVTNTQSWDRSIIARFSAPAERIQLRDVANGAAVPVQRIGSSILFRAQDVGAFAQRIYRIEKYASGQTAVPTLYPGGDTYTWFTKQYMIRFSPVTGSITELRRRAATDNLVDSASGYGLNQFLYVAGGRDSLLIDQGGSTPKVARLSPLHATVSLAENGPLFGVLCVEASLSESMHLKTYVTIRNSGDIVLENHLFKPTTLEPEAGYFAFPFRQKRRGQAFVELPYGVLSVEKEQAPGGCREWYSAGSFIATSDGSRTALVCGMDAPLFTIGDIFKGQWRKTLSDPQNRLFGYAFNNYWNTNYLAKQGGEMVFAYCVRITDGPFDAVAATHFGLEAMASMPDPRHSDTRRSECAELAQLSKSKPRTSDPWLRITGGDVVVGRIAYVAGSTLVRLYNPSAKPVAVHISVPTGLHASIALADLCGTTSSPYRKSSMPVAIGARSVQTVLVRFSREGTP